MELIQLGEDLVGKKCLGLRDQLMQRREEAGYAQDTTEDGQGQKTECAGPRGKSTTEKSTVAYVMDRTPVCWTFVAT